LVSAALSVTKHYYFAPTFSNGGLLCVARTFLCNFNIAAVEKLAFKFTKKWLIKEAIITFLCLQLIDIRGLKNLNFF